MGGELPMAVEGGGGGMTAEGRRLLISIKEDAWGSWSDDYNYAKLKFRWMLEWQYAWEKDVRIRAELRFYKLS